MRIRDLASVAMTLLCMGGAVCAEEREVRIGLLLGFTGPIESAVEVMAAGAELAMQEASESGLFLDGATVKPIRADTGCIDNALAVASAERLVGQGVKGFIGGDCSGVTAAILTRVAIPNGIAMISPAASSPALMSIDDNDLFFRTAPSDSREGKVMADIIAERGIRSIALTYTNNDYGMGLADAIADSFEAAGGVVTISTSHEDGKADYSADVATLSAAGGELLVVAGYLDQGGLGIIQASLDLGAFERFGLPSGMVGASLTDSLGSRLDGSFGQSPGSDGVGRAKLLELAKDRFDASHPLVAESYDAAALKVLAMQAAGSTTPSVYSSRVWDVANAPGELIYPGELSKALALLKAGKDIDFVGASSVELIGRGESAGRYREVEVNDGSFWQLRYR